VSIAVEIRPAAIADVPAILGLIRRLADYEKLSDACVATEELLRENLFGPHPAAEALVAQDGGRLVGFTLFFRTFSTFVGLPGIWLEDLFVLPEVRGKGIGKALLTRVAQIAVARQCGRLEWAVLDWNAPAIGFYKKLGATAMDDWTTYRVAGDALAKLGGKSR
jgi:GNAT superfamily N-acetyltransferase